MAELNVDYDIIELSFLLKSVGYQLQSCDFSETGSDHNKSIEVDLCCHTSGFKAKFVLPSEKCSCPPKPAENSASFWEVQGKAPSSPIKSELVTETSSILLPEINKKTTGLARHILLRLLQHYRNQLAPEQKIDMANLKSPVLWMGTTTFTSPNTLDSKPNGNINHSSTPLHEGLPTDKIISQTSHGISSVICPSPQISRLDSDRDVFVIQSIWNARKELDAALIHLKCNITRDISDSSILTQSLNPEQIVSKSSCGLNGSTKRRSSIGCIEGLDKNQFEFTKPQPKILSRVSKNLQSNAKAKSKVTKADTLRPTVDLKAIVNKGIEKSKMRRCGSSSSLKTSPNLPVTNASAIPRVVLTKPKK